MRTLRRGLVISAVAAAAALAPAAVSAEPPQAPPGCQTVLGTPATMTGSAQGQAGKIAAYDRVCTP